MFGFGKTKNVESGAFPYASDGSVAPYTDGVIVGTNLDTSVYLPFPGEMTLALVPPGRRGGVRDYVGTTQCVDTNTTSHAVFAGDI